MNNIVTILKPEEISFADIQSVIFASHETNRKNGLNYGTANIKVDDLQKKASTGSYFFVSLVEGQLAGCACLSRSNIHKWYYSGNVAYIELVAVLPKFQGYGIGGKLIDKCLECAQEQKYGAVLSASAERNISFMKVVTKRGFLKVGYGAGTSNNFYSNFYFKWLNSNRGVSNLVYKTSIFC